MDKTFDRSKDTLIGLDVDGVVNHFSKGAKNSKSASVGGWPIRWRPAMLDELRTRLSLPGVVGVWLTTWLQDEELLDELEELLELKEFVPLRAAYPHMVELGWGGAKFLADERFTGTSMEPSRPRWWKYTAAEMLLEKHSPRRFAWLDDDLGRVNGPNENWKTKPVTHGKFLHRTHSVAGLLPEDFKKLDGWLAMEAPE